jgi:hypothetical protein
MQLSCLKLYYNIQFRERAKYKDAVLTKGRLDQRLKYSCMFTYLS